MNGSGFMINSPKNLNSNSNISIQNFSSGVKYNSQMPNIKTGYNVKYSQSKEQSPKFKLRKYSSAPKFHIYHRSKKKTASKEDQNRKKMMKLASFGSQSNISKEYEHNSSKKKLIGKFNAASVKRMKSQETELGNIGSKIKMPDLFLKSKK